MPRKKSCNLMCIGMGTIPKDSPKPVVWTIDIKIYLSLTVLLKMAHA